jgi:hypothetical protein
MNMDLKAVNLKSLKLGQLFSKYIKKYGRHSAFAMLLVVLLTYVFVVMKIGSLSRAEPDASQPPDSSSLIPRVNQKAIEQIQSLESNNTQIHSLFEQARNNPFSE